MENQPLLIGVDGGATKVSVWEIVHNRENSTFSLGKANATKAYREIEGFIHSFKPVAINTQLNERESAKSTPDEKQQAAVYVEACALAIKELSDVVGISKVLLGIGMPGLKTENKRGIAVVANGPRMLDYSDKLEKRLSELNISLSAQIFHLGSDADYCGIGENYSDLGIFRNYENAYYLGGGTGVADAMKLNGELLTFDNAREWMAKTWEMKTKEGLPLERVTSVSGIQHTYAELANRKVEELSSSGIYPLQIAELAACGNEAAIKTFDVVNQTLAKLLYERIVTLNCGWQNVFQFGNPNREILNSKHKFLGNVFDAIVIGQRLGELFDDKFGRDVVKSPILKQLNDLIQNSAIIGVYAKQHYSNLNAIIKVSKLREAPALGAGIDAFFTK